MTPDQLAALATALQRFGAALVELGEKLTPLVAELPEPRVGPCPHETYTVIAETLGATMFECNECGETWQRTI